MSIEHGFLTHKLPSTYNQIGLKEKIPEIVYIDTYLVYYLPSCCNNLEKQYLTKILQFDIFS